MYNFFILGMLLNVLFAKAQQDTQTVCYPANSVDSKIAALEAKVAAQDSRIAAQDSTIAAQNAIMTKYEKWKESQEVKNTEFQTKIDSLKNEITEQRSSAAFFAANIPPQIVPSQGTVKFGTIRLNNAPRQYGYDTTTNHFRCPVTGVYAFFLHATTRECNRSPALVIKKGRTALAGTHAHTKSVCFLSMSAFAFSPCQKGEYVFVENVRTESIHVYSDGNVYTYFGGFKVY